jgi:type III secretion protein L
MKFFSLFSKKEVHEVAGKKVLSSQDFSTLQSAFDLLKITKQEAEEYKKESEKEGEKIKRKAYQEGFDQGLLELNKKILQLDSSIENLEKEFQKKIAPVAIKAAKKIVGEELAIHPGRIVDIVMQALKPVSQHHKIKIYVNKQDLLLLEQAKTKIKSILEQIQIFSIHERDDIEVGGCIIETEGGIINAKLENQWKALEAAFQTFTKE